jgi:glycosyltransferase involved in cell wall biosynthesis
LANKKNKISFLTYKSEKKAISSSDSVFCVSTQLIEYILKYKPENLVKFIPNGVNPNLFNPENFDKNEIKKRFGLSQKKVLGYVGTYRKWHGLDISLETIELLSKIDKSYHLVLIGSGKEFNNVKEKIRSKNLPSYVTQIPFVPHQEVAKYIACFDFALMTYPPIKNFYFSPLKIFEYMSMGIPVVTSNLGQIKEIVDDKINGILVDPPTPEGFVSGILKAQELYDQIGYNSRQLMISNYTWEKNCQEVLAMCKNLLNKQY